MSLSFKTLYFLESNKIALVEIKRTGFPNDTAKRKIYFWFLLNKDTGQLTRMEFVSMKSEAENEERIFVKGKLTFKQDTGIFKNSTGQYSLRNTPTGQLPDKFINKINDYLSAHYPPV